MEPWAKIFKLGYRELGIVWAEAVDDPFRFGSHEFGAIGSGEGGGGGSAVGEMAVGEDAGQGLGIEEARGGGLAGEDVNFGTVAPDEEVAFAFQQASGGAGILLHGQVAPRAAFALGELDVAGAEADEGDEQKEKD